ncbi:MAG: MOFRL family protein [Planctomycetaceae bacterium]
MIVLIISDVIGDPLASSRRDPTVLPTGSLDPLTILRRFCPKRGEIPDAVGRAEIPGKPYTAPAVTAKHLVIGNNRTAMEAAQLAAKSLGYLVHDLGTNQSGIAREVGRSLAEMCLQAVKNLPGASKPVCFLSGGEPTVRLTPTDQARKGGRNQELALAAGIRLWDDDLAGVVILSGGTDGEDGPTDAAGAWFDADVRERAVTAGLDPRSYLDVNNTYPFFQQTGGLLITGPTHTNVMDVRVALVSPAKTGD